MKRPVSIIVPAHNAAATLSDCIEALLVQTCGQAEIILVDNRSTDATLEIARRYPIMVLEWSQSQSSYAARNFGLAHAHGEFSLFTDADCTAAPDWAERLVAVLDRPGIAGVGGLVLDAAPQNDVESFVAEIKPLQNGQKLESAYYVSLVTANAAYRRPVLDQVGGFDERMVTGGDIDLSWRVQQRGLGEIVYAPDAVVFHKHRSTLGGMFRQFRRYGYCSGMMTALHRSDPAYPQKRGWQARTALRQSVALLTYTASLIYRNTVGLAQGRSAYERKKPALWFVAESGALLGRASAAYETRMFTTPPKGLTEWAA